MMGVVIALLLIAANKYLSNAQMDQPGRLEATINGQRR
jgi:hypothetical protein